MLAWFRLCYIYSCTYSLSSILCTCVPWAKSKQDNFCVKFALQNCFCSVCPLYIRPWIFQFWAKLAHFNKPFFTTVFSCVAYVYKYVCPIAFNAPSRPRGSCSYGYAHNCTWIQSSAHIKTIVHFSRCFAIRLCMVQSYRETRRGRLQTVSHTAQCRAVAR